MIFVIITSILVICGSYIARQYWPFLAPEYGLEEDGVVEESTEAAFKAATGYDIDFSPASEEKWKQ